MNDGFLTPGKKQMSPQCSRWDKTNPANFPVSLTCVLCKVIERNVASSLSRQFSDQTFFELQ